MFTVRIAPAEQLGGIDVLDRIEDIRFDLRVVCRETALGLPFIDKVMLGGEERTVTAYTMSEIIASVYREMERTGVKEGILFLDEINCISETLTPMMLQFLQCKTFGNQQLTT